MDVLLTSLFFWEALTLRTRVKICGITRPQDAQAVAAAGADSIGLVFYQKSSRNVSIQQALKIVAGLPPFIAVTGLFLDANRAFIREVIEQLPLTLLQFHGDESPADCRGYGLPYLKAIGMQENTQVKAYAENYADSAGFLLDSHAQGAAGGTGETFNWNQFPQDLEQRAILAGGLNPDNIAAAIEAANPWGVDLSSGVESSPGIKDVAKIEALMKEVIRVDCQR